MAEVNIDIALESTSQEILSKVANGGHPTYSETIFGSYKDNFDTHTFTGKGRLQIITLSVGNGSKATLSVDGSTWQTELGMGGLEVYFNESVSFTSTDVSMNSDSKVFVVQLV